MKQHRPRRAAHTPQPNAPQGLRARRHLSRARYGNQAMQEELISPAAPAEDDGDWAIAQEDREFFERVLDITDEDLQNQTTAWYQTTEGNCTTVAVAKAATDALGPEVFRSLERTPEGLKIGLRDGAEVRLTAEELVAAREASDFKGRDDDALAFGTVIYAAVAQRALEEKHENAKSYAEALGSLNNGEVVSHVVDLLGLEDFTRRVDVRDLDDQDAVVANSRKHAIYIDKTEDKHIADHYGKGVTYNGTDTNSSRGGRRRDRVSNAIVSAIAFRGLSEEERRANP